MDEFALIEKYLAPLADGAPGTFGLKDDAAALSCPPGRQLVITADALVAGIHFFPNDPSADIARKALRVNLSDLAAKGAKPFGYLLTVCWAKNVGDEYIAAFASGLSSDQSMYGVHLLGGDTVRADGPLTLSITAIGFVKAGHTVLRSGAAPGDKVFVTGSVGDAAAGLIMRRGRSGLEGISSAAREQFHHRYLLPQPRTELGAQLGGIASAAIDVSDGLVGDLGHLSAASGVDIDLSVERIPLSSAAREVVSAGVIGFDELLTGGDDYEIALTCAPEQVETLIKASAACNTPLTEIGVVRGDNGDRVRLLDEQGRRIRIETAGFNHFR